MSQNQCIECRQFPCSDIDTSCYQLPTLSVDPINIQMVMITDTPRANETSMPESIEDSIEVHTTRQAFHDAGLLLPSLKAMLNLGIYITTAVKCAKKNDAVSLTTIEECSQLLEREMAQFPNLKTIVLHGDAAIRALNAISQRHNNKPVVPNGSTYRLRQFAYYYKQIRVFPSYQLTTPYVATEKTRRRMIAEDIRAAYSTLNRNGR
ncbi:uracil-DNA glycosylase family protein [candidate division KSB1 bacterium]|nr:uracil-DNA glycosylase family protein [candidate division KSB1 bacterium]